MRTSTLLAIGSAVVATAVFHPAFARGVDVEPEAGTAGSVSAEPRSERVRKHTRAKGKQEVSARWSIDWPHDVVDAVARGDRIAIAGDSPGASYYAIVSAETGKIERSAEIEGCPVFATGGKALFATCGQQRSELVAVDPDTLETLWRRELGGRVYDVSPLGDVTVVTVREGEHAGLAVAIAADGTERWRTGFATETDMALSITEADDRVYVSEVDPAVWALDRSTGKLLWKVSFEDHIVDVRVDGDSIEIAHDNGWTSVDEDGKVIAERAAQGKAQPVDAVSEGDWIYTRSPDRDYQDGVINARNRATGATWRFSAARVVAARDGIVYTCSDNGILHALEGDTGEALWWADTGWDCPVTVAADRVYSAVEGYLLAFDSAEPSNGSKRVTIRGRFDEETAGLRVWIGDRVVKTDKKGRFGTTVTQRSLVTVRMDPRDVSGNTEAVVRLDGETTPIELTSWYEDCH